jgi:hypothetical protein
MHQCALPLFDEEKVDLSSGPWLMHEFFAGSGLVAYGLKDMFSPIWSNDISKQKADVFDESAGAVTVYRFFYGAQNYAYLL